MNDVTSNQGTKMVKDTAVEKNIILRNYAEHKMFRLLATEKRTVCGLDENAISFKGYLRTLHNVRSPSLGRGVAYISIFHQRNI